MKLLLKNRHNENYNTKYGSILTSKTGMVNSMRLTNWYSIQCLL